MRIQETANEFWQLALQAKERCSPTNTDISVFCINAKPPILYSFYTHVTIRSLSLVLLHLVVTKVNLITFPKMLPCANLYTQMVRYNHLRPLKARNCYHYTFSWRTFPSRDMYTACLGTHSSDGNFTSFTVLFIASPSEQTALLFCCWVGAEQPCNLASHRCEHLLLLLPFPAQELNTEDLSMQVSDPLVPRKKALETPRYNSHLISSSTITRAKKFATSTATAPLRGHLVKSFAFLWIGATGLAGKVLIFGIWSFSFPIVALFGSIRILSIWKKRTTQGSTRAPAAHSPETAPPSPLVWALLRRRACTQPNKLVRAQGRIDLLWFSPYSNNSLTFIHQHVPWCAQRSAPTLCLHGPLQELTAAGSFFIPFLNILYPSLK